MKSSLFKGLSAIFGKYDSQVINNLIRKFDELKMVDYENITAAVFCKAVFFMQEDHKNVNKPDPSQLRIKKTEVVTTLIENANSSVEIGGGSSPKKVTMQRNMQLQEDLDEERNKLLKTKGTLGRNALREQDEYQKMFNLETRDPSTIVSMSRHELMQGIER